MYFQIRYHFWISKRHYDSAPPHQRHYDALRTQIDVTNPQDEPFPHLLWTFWLCLRSVSNLLNVFPEFKVAGDYF